MARQVVNGGIDPIRFDRLNLAALRPEPAVATLRVARDGREVEVKLSAADARRVAEDLMRQVAAHEGETK